ncbi:hypothetical protein SAY87_012782 [Trapa incisa]|uniref:Uncharacterized protein n=1 Tax=Trapa incisa TaxID=236973 RepID=A0AAN7JK29_9MYRT|nr:hypothetical protein SAY87_012782 [Trapa incisa]
MINFDPSLKTEVPGNCQLACRTGNLLLLITGLPQFQTKPFALSFTLSLSVLPRLVSHCWMRGVQLFSAHRSPSVRRESSELLLQLIV